VEEAIGHLTGESKMIVSTPARKISAETWFLAALTLAVTILVGVLLVQELMT
jgi:hypothetical protein